MTAYNTAVPNQISQIIDKILSKEPTGRYRTAGQLGRILSTYRQRSLVDTGPQTPTVQEPTKDDAAVPVHEQLTQIYERPANEREKTAQTPQKNDITKPNVSVPSRPTQPPIRDKEPETIVHTITEAFTDEPDWTAITLGIAALVALLGLIPLWILVYLAWT